VTVRILREFYGSFAPHCADNEKLSDVIPKLDFLLRGAAHNEIDDDPRSDKVGVPLLQLHLDGVWAAPAAPFSLSAKNKRPSFSGTLR
jgi:hypothetical protein